MLVSHPKSFPFAHGNMPVCISSFPSLYLHVRDRLNLVSIMHLSISSLLQSDYMDSTDLFLFIVFLFQINCIKQKSTGSKKEKSFKLNTVAVHSQRSALCWFVISGPMLVAMTLTSTFNISIIYVLYCKWVRYCYVCLGEVAWSWTVIESVGIRRGGAWNVFANLGTSFHRIKCYFGYTSCTGVSTCSYSCLYCKVSFTSCTRSKKMVYQAIHLQVLLSTMKKKI